MIYTVHDVADILRCSTKTVYRLIHDKELRAKKRGHVTLISGQALLEYWESLPDADGDSADDDVEYED